MPTLTEEYVDSLAPNASAVKNGWGLVKKNQFIALYKSEDGKVLFGDCKGSGKHPYRTSVDLLHETPVARCTCPSRQFPCKHSLALLYSYISGASFTTAPIPEDILEKRSKAAARQEKKKEQSGTVRKVNKPALSKKLKAQKEGLEVLERQLHQVVRAGLMSIDAKKLKGLEDTAKQLGNYYVKEVQNELREFILLWQMDMPEDRIYSLAFEKLQMMYSICKKGKEHIEKRLEDPELLPDTTSSLEEKLGHIWQLAELREMQQTLSNVTLAQLSFTTTKNEARKEFIDEGIWLNLISGDVYFSRNYRPFRAVKQIKEDDTIFSIIHTNELFVYPGEGSRRIRWEEYQLDGVPDTNLLITLAKASLLEVLKGIKAQLRMPLADKHPVNFVQFSKVGKVEEEWVLVGHDGSRLTLTDGGNLRTLPLLELLAKQDVENGAMLLKFSHDLESGRLTGQPLTIVGQNRIVRLLG